MKLTVSDLPFYLYPPDEQGIAYIELEAEDPFEMAFLQSLLNHQFALLPNSEGPHSIFALPLTPALRKGLAEMKSAEAHLDEVSRQNRGLQ